jgi:hypothetical protein
MRGSRFKEEQIIAILREQEAGASTIPAEAPMLSPRSTRPRANSAILSVPLSRGFSLT